jgi:hypothetical protein
VKLSIQVPAAGGKPAAGIVSRLEDDYENTINKSAIPVTVGQ